MKVSVFGTGMVGVTIATKLIEEGHEVMMGSRSATNENAMKWAQDAGDKATCGTYEDAAKHADLYFNCTNGMGTLEALQSAGADHLADGVLIDVSNPLDFSKGMPPTLFVSNDDSLGEQIQRTFPKLKVVKSLNTVNCEVMVDAKKVAGSHTIFMSGNDSGAKERVHGILANWFGWSDIIDLGDITTARGTESLMPIWIRLWQTLGHANFNFKIVR